MEQCNTRSYRFYNFVKENRHALIKAAVITGALAYGGPALFSTGFGISALFSGIANLGTSGLLTIGGATCLWNLRRIEDATTSLWRRFCGGGA
jgi:hypothetical protein